MLKKFFLFVNTIKYLKLVQIYYRLFYRIVPQKKINHPFHYSLSQKESWLKYDYNYEGMFDDNEFYFLNKRGFLHNKNDWNDITKDKLWLYNLHYFDYLNSHNQFSNNKLSLIHRWIDENPIGHGNGWEPYTISLRLVNWIKYVNNNNINCNKVLDSISIQSRFLYQRPEYHIQANHLFSNAKALIFAGAFFDGVYAEKILKKGMNIFNEEIQTQILNDGSHFELSPMYHSIFLLDLLDLYNLANTYPLKFNSRYVSQLSKYILKMDEWLQHILHPNTELPFMNDCTNKVAIDYTKIKQYMTNLNIPNIKLKPEKVELLKDSGFLCINEERYFFIGNFSKVKSSFQPGHFHAATLSFELSIGENKVFVNSGISTYNNNSLREFQRSTSAHNTLSIDNKNSSSVWSSFRLGNRVKNVPLQIYKNKEYISVDSSHDGYKNFLTGQYHDRKFIFTKEKITINDKIIGKFQSAILRFYIHPIVEIVKKTSNSVQFRIEKKYFTFKSDLRLRVIDAEYYPEFGIADKNKCIEIEMIDNECYSEISI